MKIMEKKIFCVKKLFTSNYIKLIRVNKNIFNQNLTTMDKNSPSPWYIVNCFVSFML